MNALQRRMAVRAASEHRRFASAGRRGRNAVVWNVDPGDVDLEAYAVTSVRHIVTRSAPASVRARTARHRRLSH
jgi:hypothetical protein